MRNLNFDVRSTALNTGRLSRQVARFAALPLAIAGIVSSAVPAQADLIVPERVITDRQTDPDAGNYRTCVSALKKAGVGDAQVNSTCAGALYPQDMATCVTRVNETGIGGAEAAANCRRVRRPLELATCVVDISKLSEGASADVVDHCRRSILPLRFSACVVGLREETSLPVNEALGSCIASSDRPRSLTPAFPTGAPMPTAPTAPTTAPMPATPDTLIPTPATPTTPAPAPDAAPPAPMR
jgi:hypothetical protein